MEMEENLNEINSDIEIKTKLIQQLELSQERIQLLRQHYEEKLTALTSKIFNTQKERDEVLASMSKFKYEVKYTRIGKFSFYKNLFQVLDQTRQKTI